MEDCANSHMEVENTLIRLREATAEINRATDDTRMRSILEKTWVLQDRLVFANQVGPYAGIRPFPPPNLWSSLVVIGSEWSGGYRDANVTQRLDASSKNRIRSFGHIKLCGTLHVCWATKNGVDGQYMVCLLYQDVLCIASAGKADQIYTIQAVINLESVKVEEVDDGRGKPHIVRGNCMDTATDTLF